MNKSNVSQSLPFCFRLLWSWRVGDRGPQNQLFFGPGPSLAPVIGIELSTGVVNFQADATSSNLSVDVVWFVHLLVTMWFGG